MIKIISFIIVTIVLFLSPAYSMPSNSIDILRVPLVSNKSTDKNDFNRITYAYTLQEAREILTKKLKEAGIDFRGSGIPKGLTFTEAEWPSAQQISWEQFWAASYEASKVLTAYKDFRVIYKAPLIRATGIEKLSEADENEAQAYIMHDSRGIGMPNYPLHKEYITKKSSSIELIPAGKLIAQEPQDLKSLLSWKERRQLKKAIYLKFKDKKDRKEVVDYFYNFANIDNNLPFDVIEGLIKRSKNIGQLKEIFDNIVPLFKDYYYKNPYHVVKVNRPSDKYIDSIFKALEIKKRYGSFEVFIFYAEVYRHKFFLDKPIFGQDWTLNEGIIGYEEGDELDALESNIEVRLPGINSSVAVGSSEKDTSL